MPPDDAEHCLVPAQVVFCWRPVERTLGNEIDVELDEPKDIVEESIKKQKGLLGGYLGHEEADMDEVKEAFEPKHAAISLADEPTTYPYIDELINAYHKRGLTTFLATNGQNPEKLESVCNDGGIVRPCSGWSDLFICPEYQFRAPIDALLTNFHLPKSTLLMLVCAYAGKDEIFNAYQIAVKERYRFYSFGDAMLIHHAPLSRT